MSELIDRQAVIDLLKQMRKDGNMVPWEGKDVFARIRKLPTIQPEKTQLFQEGKTFDTISRQAAIDGVKTLHDVAWKNWHEPTLSANAVLDMIMELPSAQPEIIRCADCKHKGTRNCVANTWATIFGFEVKDDFYCGLAERITK